MQSSCRQLGRSVCYVNPDPPCRPPSSHFIHTEIVASCGFLKLRLPPSRRLVRYAIIAAAVAMVCWLVAPFLVSLPAGLTGNPGASPVLLDRNGVPISHLTLPDSSRSNPVALDKIPADLIACTLAAEDKRFYNHGGVDYLATGRAARDFFSKRRIVSGASTITQQLIKISSPPARRNLFTKLYESLAARRLEMKWTKSQILVAYLNRLDYGNLRTGTSEAARFYFQKPLADLSLAEAALLAGLPQAPSRLNPLRNPKRAINRRNTVLQRLAAIGEVDATRITSALAEPLSLRPLQESNPAPWLASLTIPPSTNLNQKIKTTLDLTIQRDIEAIVHEETSKLKEANLRHAAVVVIHNPTGEIRALVSSANWADPRGGQLNGALSPRSPGSTLKPFTYLLAMERLHRTPASIIADIPSPFRTLEGLDLPQNYDHAYRGPVTLRSALACSLNIPAMRELNALGGPAPLHELLVKLGLTTLGTDPNADGLGLTIGNAPVRLLELTNAYATLARAGNYLPTVLFPSAPHASPLRLPFSENSFFLIADILSDPLARAPAFPPGGPLDLPFRCAVKTGTSSDFRDNWCIGFTPDFTVGVWAGNFENQPMKGISGIAGAGPIFNRAMLRIHRNHPPTWFKQPADLTTIRIDSRTGKLVSAGTNNPHIRADISPSVNLPPSADITDYDATGKALLDPTYASWFTSRYNLRNGELALNPLPTTIEPLKIITPADGATFLLDPEIPSNSDKLRPLTNLPGTAQWSSPTLQIEPASPEPIIHLTLGTHVLTATDPRTGTSQNITLHIKQL
ncbi:MAG: transglycosylase domain-containing protein [Gloeobacteraceae cyanobacterium ES-bin-144]|nr:transglycosylase domain-containing protein [Verrucomicrobiales bacterium]